jgi:hypothetical protein
LAQLCDHNFLNALPEHISRKSQLNVGLIATQLGMSLNELRQEQNALLVLGRCRVAGTSPLEHVLQRPTRWNFAARFSASGLNEQFGIMLATTFDE